MKKLETTIRDWDPFTYEKKKGNGYSKLQRFGVDQHFMYEPSIMNG